VLGIQVLVVQLFRLTMEIYCFDMEHFKGIWILDLIYCCFSIRVEFGLGRWSKLVDPNEECIRPCLVVILTTILPANSPVNRRSWKDHLFSLKHAMLTSTRDWRRRENNPRTPYKVLFGLWHHSPCQFLVLGQSPFNRDLQHALHPSVVQLNRSHTCCTISLLIMAHTHNWHT